jgi:hypothetical protein
MLLFDFSLSPFGSPYIRIIHEPTNNTVSMSDHIEKLEHLKVLRDNGTLTEEEFQTEKSTLLSGHGSAFESVSEIVKPTEKNKGFRTFLFLALGLIALVVTVSVIRGSDVDEETPSYIKKVAAYKEGDGIVVYFILANESGGMVRSSGSAHLVVTSELGSPLVDVTMPVKSSDFYKTEVGMGNFKHDATVYSFGRIPIKSEGIGKVSIDFTRGGKVISGNDMVVF